LAGSGIVEASTENISIGTQIAGIVSKIFVEIGSNVKEGDPLFKIDDRSLLAELNIRRAAVQVAEVQLADAQYELALAESLSVERIASVEELDKDRFAAQRAQAQLGQAKAELESINTELERLAVRAPVAGQVLQLKVHLGEFAQVAPTTPGQSPLILLGSVTPLHVRVDVDENDASRVCPGASAIGCLRGNKDVKVPLAFVRFEPYVLPKKSLTGDSTERVDTRVLQVVFSFERGELPIYVGQQMDVFIDTTDPLTM
jgi:RND family efflux transporter MFP subunit